MLNQMIKPLSFLTLAAMTATVACSGPDTKNAELNATALEAIQAESYVEHVKKLSSDEFEGRKPFTAGDTLTVNYIEQQFIDLGLEPGNGSSYFQAVPMVEITSTPTSNSLTLKAANGSVSLNYLDDFVVGSQHQVEAINVEETELVFAGFGIVAPEYNWNDYEGLDVEGKTVVVMVNDPGHYDRSLFKGETMTYYGRWTYKFEEAARQGATGVLIIHETGAASYGWNVVRTGWTGPQLNLQSPDKGATRADFEGWISGESAEKLFQLAGIEEDLIATAKKPGFRPVALGVTTGVSIRNTFRESTSNNVIGKITGTKRPDETIIYTAHWDHLGIGEAVDGDSIYNGAIDNATGVAALFELAKGFKAADIQPERSIIFLAVTAEEEGLLGSKYYAENPIYPLNKTVVNINMDSFHPIGRANDFAVVGLGQSDIDEYVIQAAQKQGRVVVAGGNPSAGSFFRSDHFNFVKAGVPALYGGSGKDVIDADPKEIEATVAGIYARYHQVSDEYDESWVLDGIIEDLRLLLDIGYTLSMENGFPGWKEGSEFKEIGEQRLKQN